MEQTWASLKKIGTNPKFVVKNETNLTFYKKKEIGTNCNFVAKIETNFNFVAKKWNKLGLL